LGEGIVCKKELEVLKVPASGKEWNGDFAFEENVLICKERNEKEILISQQKK